MRCARCDEIHPTKLCPWFKDERDDHPDAVPLPIEERPPLLPNALPIIAKGEVERQPPDGSCLYHSLARGGRELDGHWLTARELRKQLAAFCAANGLVSISGKTFNAWLQLEHGVKVRVCDAKFCILFCFAFYRKICAKQNRPM